MRRFALAALVCAAAVSGVPALAHARAPAKPSVVVLNFDELPTLSLLDAAGRIDPIRYPNLASLAHDGTWYRNTMSVYDQTFLAVPAIMDARLPREGVPRTVEGHPHSIFTLFHDHGYAVHADEVATAVCPVRICPRNRRRRLDVGAGLRKDRLADFERFIGSVGPGSRPTLWYKHVLLPHSPWIFFPSGNRYRDRAHEPLPKAGSSLGFHDPGLVDQYHQRHLLQLGFLDREVGRLIARLRAAGMYDRTMIVVVADHGISFRAGSETRREVNGSNIAEIAPVPFILKPPSPDGFRGRVDRTYVRTVDVLPTIARRLGLRVNWRHDGRSAVAHSSQARHTISMPLRDFSGVVRISAGLLERRRRGLLAHQIRVFGTGASPPGLFGLGPRRDLVGRPLSSFSVRSAHGLGRRFTGPAAAPVTAPGFVPALVQGTVAGGHDSGRDLIVAVNGRVAATARSFRLRGRTLEQFSVLVPETALRGGRNSVEVLLPTHRRGQLARLPAG